MADERVVPEDLKALYNAAEVARDYADSRAQANQVLGLIERIADLQAKLEEMKDAEEYGNEMERRWDAGEKKQADLDVVIKNMLAELQRLRDENMRIAGEYQAAQKWLTELLSHRSQEAQKGEDNNG